MSDGDEHGRPGTTDDAQSTTIRLGGGAVITTFYFRVGPTGGPLELVAAAPRRYAITNPDPVQPDRGPAIPDDLRPCGIAYACNVCDTRALEPEADLQDDNWIKQLSHHEHSTLDTWWPFAELERLEDRDGPGAGAELVERVGHVHLCPGCHARHGDPDDWPQELLDRVYGPEGGPPRTYPQRTPG